MQVIAEQGQSRILRLRKITPIILILNVFGCASHRSGDEDVPPKILSLCQAIEKMHNDSCREQPVKYARYVVAAAPDDDGLVIRLVSMPLRPNSPPADYTVYWSRDTLKSVDLACVVRATRLDGPESRPTWQHTDTLLAWRNKVWLPYDAAIDKSVRRLGTTFH
jgi:hypothetical protein